MADDMANIDHDMVALDRMIQTLDDWGRANETEDNPYGGLMYRDEAEALRRVKQRAQRAEAALRFYAEPSHWTDDYDQGACRVLVDHGAKAREVLATQYYSPEMAGSGQRGICVHCGKGPTGEGHDGCLGTLPEDVVMNACCGHGDDSQAYVQYWSGECVRGDRALEVIEAMKTTTHPTPEQTESCYCILDHGGPDPLCQMCDGTGRSPIEEPDEPEQTGDELAMFGHHADPVIDFCVEVECLESIAADWQRGLRPYSELQPRLPRALEFRVGGNESALLAKDRLRVLEQSLNTAPAEHTGDALAAFEKALWLILPEGANTQAHREALPLLQEVRRHLTASGVPEGWEWRTERDVTDEYMTSLIAPDGTTVYVGDDEKAAAWLESLLSANRGVPYVPEEVAGLPEVWKQRYLDQARNTVAHALADELELVVSEALASAPADGYRLVPVEPTLAMAEAADRAVNDQPEDWSRGGFQGDDNVIAYRAMIAAAPTDGGE